MRLMTSIIASAMMVWAALSAQAAEMPAPKALSKSNIGVGGAAVPGFAVGRTAAEDRVQLAQRRGAGRRRGIRRRARRRGRRWRGGAAAAGAAALIIGGAIAAAEAEAAASEWRYRCRRWRRQCRRGNDWACDKWDDRC